MARFISHTIWCESGVPLELIAFPRCCVGVIGCSKAALGSDSWAEVGQEQLASAPSPAACQKAFEYGLSMPLSVCIYVCVYVCAAYLRVNFRQNTNFILFPEVHWSERECTSLGLSWTSGIGETDDKQAVVSGDDSTSVSLHLCSSRQVTQPRRHVICRI